MNKGVLATMSNGGSCICVKFDVISSILSDLSEINIDDFNKLSEILKVAKEDGQNMEDALIRKNKKIMELEEELRETKKELKGSKKELEETKWDLKQAENDIKRLEKERIDMGL